MLITHQQKGNTMTVSLTKTPVSLTKEPNFIRITKAGSDRDGSLADVERVTKSNAVVCYVRGQGYRTYQQGQYEVIG